MMNIRVIQPPYPKRAEDTPASVAFMIEQLRRCDESLDLILLPECCNAPSGCGDSSLLRKLVAEHTQPLLDAVKETAIRCKAVVGINLYVYGEGYETVVRNATQLYDSKGNLAVQYDKQHLPVSEYTNDSIDHSYLTGSINPFCTEVEGVRYAFLTCYDMYYTEFIHRISLEKPDVVLICSLQRAERPDILEMQGKNTAFVCNSYVVRSSYHMGPDATTGACSMVVTPDGTVLQNFGQGLGSFDCQVEDIHWKYRRSNGFGQPQVTNDVYQTLFRSPWCYRVGGSGVRADNAQMPFPRLCATRGCMDAAPENSIPGIAIAVAMGAEEVALDVRQTADGVPVLSRDADVLLHGADKVQIRDLTWDQLQKLNPGKQFSAAYDSVGFASLEAVFAAFPRRTVFQLHIPTGEDCRSLIHKIQALADRYDCRGYFYISSEDEAVLNASAEEAPDVECCLICTDGDPVAKTLALGCTRFQISAEHLKVEHIQRAKAAKVRCNVVLGDESNAQIWRDLEVDCILTDHYMTVSAGLKNR